MTIHQKIAAHYTHGNLLNSIQTGIEKLGKTRDTITIEDLGPVDEFHIGGRQATIDFLDPLHFSDRHHLIDVGCGLGGASRFVADRYGCQVTGIDLTEEYVQTGKVLCDWVGLHDQVTLHQGSALKMPFDDERFDGGYMMHVGMNIQDKVALYREVYRVLRAGAVFGVYDVMQMADGDLTYPVPWATTTHESSVASPDQYKQALQASGFSIVAERNRREFALSFFEQLKNRTSASSGPLPLGLHILMGESAAIKVQNMIKNISDSLVAPVELVAKKS